MLGKEWHGKKVKNRNGKGYGWLDAEDNIWVPSDKNYHENFFWRVQKVNGGYIQIALNPKSGIQDSDNVLVCKSVLFYHDKDEDAFFEWVKKIDCVDTISRAGDELYLHIAADDIHDHDLRDIMGLFRRYNVDMKQLARFLTDKNKKWFYENKKASWHVKIFGT